VLSRFILTAFAYRSLNEHCISGTTSIYWVWSARTWRRFCR